MYLVTVDGQWTSWTNWTECDKACDEGHQIRIRRCANPPPLYNGEPCVGNDIETQACTIVPCPGITHVNTMLVKYTHNP